MITMKDRIKEMLEVGNLPKDIADYVGCDISYVYQVRKMENGGKSTRIYTKSGSPKKTHTYEGPEGLKTLLDEYEHACKTIDKVINYLLEENSDLREQVRQFNQIIRSTGRPVFTPTVIKAMVIHGD